MMMMMTALSNTHMSAKREIISANMFLNTKPQHLTSGNIAAFTVATNGVKRL